MNIHAQIVAADKAAVDLLVLGIFSETKKITGPMADADKRLGGVIQNALDLGDINGKSGSTSTFYTQGHLKCSRILICGLGKKAEFNVEALRRFVADAVARARQLNVESVAFTHLRANEAKLALDEFSHILAETALLANYRYEKFKRKLKEDINLSETVDEKKKLETIVILAGSKKEENALEKGIEIGLIFGEATNIARELVNGPRNDVTPDTFVAEAREIAKAPNMVIEVLDKADMVKLGAGCFSGVAQGSDGPAYMVILEYRKNKTKPPVAFVGKGITFDTGGISIKPSAKMMEMKMDMAGAAAVLGAMYAVSKLQPDENVVGTMVLTDNMPSGHAYTPGDILTALNGKTVEINSTDAEGRLVLADALTYTAREYQPKMMIDLATLTGACVVALGHYRAALMSNHQPSADRVFKAAEQAGELYWQMPIDKAYKKLLKSKYADLINNASVPQAGSVTAAVFLQEFVEGSNWVHLDIAGTAMENNDVFSYMDKTATGFGVRTLIRTVI